MPKIIKHAVFVYRGHGSNNKQVKQLIQSLPEHIGIQQNKIAQGYQKFKGELYKQYKFINQKHIAITQEAMGQHNIRLKLEKITQ